MENNNHFEDAVREPKADTAEEIILASDSAAEEAGKDSAAPAAAQPAEEAETAALAEDVPEKAVRIHEILALRGENRKVYRMSDGTEQAVFYAEPVHVFDEETQCFEAADTAFTEKADAFVSGKNRFAAEFSKDAANGELFRMADGAHRITVFSAQTGRQKRRGAAAAETSPAADTLVFEQAEAGADFVYSLTGSGIKENIVIREKADVYRYSFLLKCENVAAEWDEAQKSLTFRDTENGKEVFCIPAPFMSDESGSLSADVSYDCRKLDSGDLLLTVTADSEWINDAERVFPVVIDPQIKVSGTSAMTTYSWAGGNMFSASAHTVGTNGGCQSGCHANRMYIGLKLPELPGNPRIKHVELKLFQSSGSAQCGYPKLGLYQVKGALCGGSCPPAADAGLVDYDTVKSGSGVSYSFDITKLADAAAKGETAYANLVLRLMDESTSCGDKIVLYGSTYGETAKKPQLVVTYESGSGVNTAYRTHTHRLGRFGQGSIDLACGNLMFESEDFAWAGGRMPVTLKHLYTSALAAYPYTANPSVRLNTADFSAMKLGCGFKLNVMQSMVPVSFQHEGAAYTGYVYIGENGDETYFKPSSKTCTCGSGGQCYTLYEEVNGGDRLYDPEKRTLTGGDEVYAFDASGRLIKVTSGKNSMAITYTSGRITSVTDGAGRVFGFAYNAGGYLTSITAPDNTHILYAYSGDKLGTVTYPDGRKAALTYAADKPAGVTLFDAAGGEAYRVAYIFTGDRLTGVTEYGFAGGEWVQGTSTVYAYSAAARRTVAEVTTPADADEEADSVVRTVYAFDNDGNVISEYMYSQDTGNTGTDGGESGINPRSDGAGVVSNINNLLTNHSFESLSGWASMPGNCGSFEVSNYNNDAYAKFGTKTCWLRNYGSDCGTNGIYQVTNVLPAGEYTFSAYARIDGAFSGADDPGVFIRVTDTADNVLAESERLTAYDTAYTRLIAPFALDAARSVKVQLLINGRGSVDVDAAQLENNRFANAYNLLENGSFERDTAGWTCTPGVSVSTGTRFNMSRALYMSGDLDALRCASQRVAVKTGRATRETFTLSGWAKGRGITDRERDHAQTPQFRLRAEIKYKGTDKTETHTADFSPCTEEWQLASVQFAKSDCAQVEYITVYCDYSYNFGGAYFDNIQLLRDSIETGLSASDFTAESEGADTEETADESKGAAADSTPDFAEARDAFGNALTETTFTDGEFGTIYRAFGFNADTGSLTGDDTGNNLVRETDARGGETHYAVDTETSRNEEVTDRCGNKTAYTYDAAGRTTGVTSKSADGAVLAQVSYAYDPFDNLTAITRGDGLSYALAYNAFHNLESVGIDGKTKKLIRYRYKNGSGRLKAITYANGDTMTATYNSAGQMVAEKWVNASNEPVAHYKYVYDGQGNIVRSLDITANKEYTYTYEDGKIVRAAECDITLSGEIVTAKHLVNSIVYSYDADGKLTKKRITAGGKEQTVYCENPENENAVVKFTAGGKTVTSHSKTDSFGRKVFDELQLGTGFVSRQFHYHAGEVTDEHKAEQKLKSSPTTQLVSQIVLSGGRTIAYEYDAEERITEVTDSVGGVTTSTAYTYDALGQLLIETVNGAPVNVMTYDRYGNIASKNGTVYTYGDAVWKDWKDLLTKVGDQPITYDAQGNPTTYLGHTLAWEKGRQLKSFDNIAYTYNANGIRTSKTVNGVNHIYALDGTKILCEKWDDNTIIPLYDNEDGVCGIVYNDEPFYFQKNLQGDVVAIFDKNVETVARYSYDAWGVCTVVSDTSDCAIATVNPYRYRGYYYDNEIGMYYLQSRYYDPAVGRFVNGDEPFIGSVLFHERAESLFAYCRNSPVERVDALGYASYSNSYQKKGEFKYRVTTKIKFWHTNLICKYIIENGVIRFKFAENNYWSVLWRGGAKTLAEAMYKAGKHISSRYLKGRTIGGIHTELFIHWALYNLHIKVNSTERADMGAAYGSISDGYDSNAWVFEVGNVMSRVAQMIVYGLWGYISLLRDLARYF